MTGKLVVI